MAISLFKIAMYRIADREILTQNAIFKRFEADKSIAMPGRSFLIIGADVIKRENSYDSRLG